MRFSAISPMPCCPQELHLCATNVANFYFFFFFFQLFVIVTVFFVVSFSIVSHFTHIADTIRTFFLKRKIQKSSRIDTDTDFTVDEWK